MAVILILTKLDLKDSSEVKISNEKIEFTLSLISPFFQNATICFREEFFVNHTDNKYESPK